MQTQNERLKSIIGKLRERNINLRQPYAERMVKELNNKLIGNRRR